MFVSWPSALTSVNDGSGFQMDGVRALGDSRAASGALAGAGVAIRLDPALHVVGPRDVVRVQQVRQVRPRVEAELLALAAAARAGIAWRRPARRGSRWRGSRSWRRAGRRKGELTGAWRPERPAVSGRHGTRQEGACPPGRDR